MELRSLTCKAVAALAFVAMSTAAQASSNPDANARVAFSDKLSMYSQRIAGSACIHVSPDAPYESRGFLAVASTEINRILNALERGDLALGIRSPEDDEVILSMLDDIGREWFPINALSETIRRGEATEEYTQMLEARVEDFTQTSYRLVSLISNKYTDSNALTLADSLRIQVAGRQRMLAQKMSFEACKIQRSGLEEDRKKLSETIRFFDRSADALRNGLPEVGLIETTEPELIAALDEIDAAWSELKWPLFALEGGSKWDTKTQQRMFLKINELTHKLDQAVNAFKKIQ